MTKRRRRKCRECRDWFQPAPTGRPPRFCSAACRQRNFTRRHKARPRRPLPEAAQSDLEFFRFRQIVTPLVAEALIDLGLVTAEDAHELEAQMMFQRWERLPTRKPRRAH